MRYFRTASDAVYEGVRRELDNAWGLPSNGQETCYMPASKAIKDTDGRCLLAVPNEFCEYDAVASVLPGLLAAGAVEEISAATYRASLPQPPYYRTIMQAFQTAMGRNV